MAKKNWSVLSNETPQKDIFVSVLFNPNTLPQINFFKKMQAPEYSWFTQLFDLQTTASGLSSDV